MTLASSAQVTAIRNFIGGQWRSSNTNEQLEVTNPATGEQLARVPLASSADVDEAVRAAASAFPSWRRTPPEDRIQYLFKLKQLLEDHID